MTRKLRLGIDVGGTFTDVVAIDAATRQLVARVKVPTTHTAPEGVAAGIVAGIEALLRDTNVSPDDVAFIAHSTTQATNALLEGDVANVGVLALAPRWAFLARAQMQLAPLELAPGVTFAPRVAYARSGNDSEVNTAIARLAGGGAEAVAVSAPFSVDRPAGEAQAAALARDAGLFATTGHDVSTLYGLRARTRTTAINAAILPKMLATARMTAGAVTRARIGAPLMIMRSDGGVMDVGEVERRPILTLLSGPAAGVAGALLYENVTDGIFIEVGGTSADCAAIRAGQPQMRAARVGGHRTMLQTIDSRTLGIGGGSMVRMSAGRVIDVGPRSAHIAGCAYAAFSRPELVEACSVESIAPVANDPHDYVVLRAPDGSLIAPTLTCAANVLAFVHDDDFARGDAHAARLAFEKVAALYGRSAEELAREIVDRATAKVASCIDGLIADYELDRRTLMLVGGGGGAASLVPALAQRMHLSHRIARNAEVISPIGVALALVRDVVERTIVNPSADDIVAIRHEAADRVIAAGAAPDRVEVSVEIDAQRNRVRATASGATALVEAAAHGARESAERRIAAARSINADAVALGEQPVTSSLTLYVHGSDARIVDERAVVRRALRGATVTPCTVAEASEVIREAMERATTFGDVGRALPELLLLYGARIIDAGGLVSLDQAIALCAEELRGRDGAEQIAVVTVPRSA